MAELTQEQRGALESWSEPGKHSDYAIEGEAIRILLAAHEDQGREIERLQFLATDWEGRCLNEEAGRKQAEAKLAEAQAEVERLRELARTEQINRESVVIERNRAEVEIERLRDQIENLLHRATTEEAAERAEQAEASAKTLRETLREIEEGAGPFSCDPLEHAANCIKAMKQIARAALAASPEPDPPEEKP